MDFYINLKVNFRGNSKNFLLSGSETKSWESMEAMVSRGDRRARSPHTVSPLLLCPAPIHSQSVPSVIDDFVVTHRSVVFIPLRR